MRHHIDLGYVSTDEAGGCFTDTAVAVIDNDTGSHDLRAQQVKHLLCTTSVNRFFATIETEKSFYFFIVFGISPFLVTGITVQFTLHNASEHARINGVGERDFKQFRYFCGRFPFSAILNADHSSKPTSMTSFFHSVFAQK
jgi:hypothetical protein